MTGFEKRVTMMSDEDRLLIEKYVDEKDPVNVPDDVNRKLCDNCTLCCEHVALQIDEPEDKEDFQNIMWYIMHENVTVFIDHDGDWHVEFKARCKALDDKGLCQVYSDRPKICAEYTQDNCEKNGSGENCYEVCFKTRDDVRKWVRENTEFKDF